METKDVEGEGFDRCSGVISENGRMGGRVNTLTHERIDAHTQ
jgi:hypothetical protein